MKAVGDVCTRDLSPNPLSLIGVRTNYIAIDVVGDDDVVEDDLLYLVSDQSERKLIGEVSPPGSHVPASIPALKMAVMMRLLG